MAQLFGKLGGNCPLSLLLPEQSVRQDSADTARNCTVEGEVGNGMGVMKARREDHVDEAVSYLVSLGRHLPEDRASCVIPRFFSSSSSTSSQPITTSDRLYVLPRKQLSKGL